MRGVLRYRSSDPERDVKPMAVLLFFIVVVAALLALAGLLHAVGNYAPALARLLR